MAMVSRLKTTLLDPGFASPRALDALYTMHWNIEEDFRTIKITPQMDGLRCKSQSMVEKEIAVCLPAYNLVRWAGCGGIAHGCFTAR